MKKLLIFLFAILFFSGCATSIIEINKTLPDFNQERTAYIGDSFFEHLEESVKKINDAEYPMVGGFRFDLTIVELNDQKVGLQYSEYTRAINYTQTPFGPIPTAGNWLIKEGFNKRFDYAVADKIIRFKGYEFEVVSVEKGQIKYRRVK